MQTIAPLKIKGAAQGLKWRCRSNPNQSHNAYHYRNRDSTATRVTPSHCRPPNESTVVLPALSSGSQHGARWNVSAGKKRPTPVPRFSAVSAHPFIIPTDEHNTDMQGRRNARRASSVGWHSSEKHDWDSARTHFRDTSGSVHCLAR